MRKLFSFLMFAGIIMSANSVELELDTERVKPGIVFVFEGAIKDKISPSSLHLSEEQTHVHIEARVNWDEEKIPKGAVPGGFIPYLRITAQVINQKTGLSTFVDVVPHINLIDNFQYARNISLPDSISNLYKVVFTVLSPSSYDLLYMKSWWKAYGDVLLKEKQFMYKS